MPGCLQRSSVGLEPAQWMAQVEDLWRRQPQLPRSAEGGRRKIQSLIGDRKISAVAIAPSLAFEIFTTDIDRWWRRGLKFRHSASRSGLLCIESRVGGRLFESFERDGAAHVVEVGRVRVWEPPNRLCFSWRNSTFAPHEHTEVQVEFAPTPSGTLVP